MVARNGKNMMTLLRLPILTPLLLKREILWTFESSKNLQELLKIVESLNYQNLTLKQQRSQNWQPY